MTRTVVQTYLGSEEDLEANPASTSGHVTRRLGIPEQTVRALIPADLRRLLLNDVNGPKANWSDKEITEGVARAGTYQWPLSSVKYDELLALGEIQGPSSVRISQRLGSWSSACAAAGVESVPHVRGDYQSRWTDDDLLGLVADYLRSPGTTGTFAGYNAWRTASQLDAPSGQTVRNRLGSWTAAKQRAIAYISERGETMAILGKESMRLDAVLAAHLDQETRQRIWTSAREILEHGPRAGSPPGSTCLALGLVQSGKTTSITALLAAAADAGYVVAVTILGSTNILLDQNRSRLEMALGIGSRQDYVWVTEPNLSGVSGSKRLRAHLDRHRTVLIPVLKHAGRLRALGV